MLSIALKQKSVCLRSLPKTCLPVARFNSNKTIDERERTFEDKNVRDHDRRLAEEYAKKLEADRAGGSTKAASQADTQSVRLDLEAQILEVRKEALDEVRECKDEIAQLKFRIKRLESRL